MWASCLGWLLILGAHGSRLPTACKPAEPGPLSRVWRVHMRAVLLPSTLSGPQCQALVGPACSQPRPSCSQPGPSSAPAAPVRRRHRVGTASNRGSSLAPSPILHATCWVFSRLWVPTRGQRCPVSSGTDSLLRPACHVAGGGYNGSCCGCPPGSEVPVSSGGLIAPGGFAVSVAAAAQHWA